MHLGRYQAGDFVPLSLLCLDPSWVAAVPTTQPTAKIYDSAGTLKATVNLTVKDKVKRPGLFDRRWQVTAAAGTGAFIVVYEYTSTNAYKTTAMFDVVAGGNEDGAVIAAGYLNKPEASYVLFETDAGKLFQGRNPY